MSERFYLNCALRPGPVEIRGPEAHHLATVSRLRAGDRIYLFNGDGLEYPAQVVDVARRSVVVEVLSAERCVRESRVRTQVVVPLPKGDRGQFLVEKLTELGVSSLIPLRTARSVVHPGESRREKLERHVIEASKQCGRNVLMTVGVVVDWRSYCGLENLPALRLLAHPGGESLTALGHARSWEELVFAVGPEGGFTEAEVELARASEWRLVDLGPRTLRVETAALALAAWASLLE